MGVATTTCMTLRKRYITEASIVTRKIWKSYDTISNCTESVEYQRIYSRIIEMCIPVMVVGLDYRKMIQKEKLNRNKERLLNGGDRS